MDARTSYLVTMILTGLVILAGLVVVIVGIARKNKKLIALGVFISLLPTLISYFTK